VDQATNALERALPGAKVWRTVGTYLVDRGPASSAIHVVITHNVQAGYRVDATDVDSPATAEGWHSSDLDAAIFHTQWQDLDR
jgi:hypothetical protein